MTGRPFVAFDLEIAKPFPARGDWRDVRPMGITCAATLEEPGKSRVWHGSRQADGRLAGQMHRDECQSLARALLDWHAQGLTIVTWNGLGFDFDILVEECRAFPERDETVDLAMHHADMAFAMLCDRGFMVSLDAAAKGMGLQGKLPGMRAELAPVLWAQSAQDQAKVLDYVAQDVAAIADVFQTAHRRGRIDWVNKSGGTSSWRLPGGRIPSVSEALLLPEPDTSWMSRPWPRSRFTQWTGRMPE